MYESFLCLCLQHTGPQYFYKISILFFPPLHEQIYTIFFLFCKQTDAPYSSSQSSSNTLSSNASSSTHSDEKWYEVGSRSGARSDLELNGYLQGTSTDSGIDATSYTATQSSTASSTGAFRSKEKIPWQDEAGSCERASSTSPPTPDSLVPAGGSEISVKSPAGFTEGPDGASFTLSDAASHSRWADVLKKCKFLTY